MPFGIELPTIQPPTLDDFSQCFIDPPDEEICWDDYHTACQSLCGAHTTAWDPDYDCQIKQCNL